MIVSLRSVTPSPIAHESNRHSLYEDYHPDRRVAIWRGIYGSLKGVYHFPHPFS